MRIPLSDYFIMLGYKVGYTVKDRDGRMDIHLIKSGRNGGRKCIAYAKYLWMSHHKMNVPERYQVDHINNDKTDDRIENLQILTRKANIKKSHIRAKIITLNCPICNKEFNIEARNLPFRKDPTCSVACGRVKASKTLKDRYHQPKQYNYDRD